eukprot:6780526-Prymnesium_polylepis.2
MSGSHKGLDVCPFNVRRRAYECDSLLAIEREHVRQRVELLGTHGPIMDGALAWTHRWSLGPLDHARWPWTLLVAHRRCYSMHRPCVALGKRLVEDRADPHAVGLRTAVIVFKRLHRPKLEASRGKGVGQAQRCGPANGGLGRGVARQQRLFGHVRHF